MAPSQAPAALPGKALPIRALSASRGGRTTKFDVRADATVNAASSADLPEQFSGKIFGMDKVTVAKIVPLGFMFFCILFNYTILRDTKVSANRLSAFWVRDYLRELKPPQNDDQHRPLSAARNPRNIERKLTTKLHRMCSW